MLVAPRVRMRGATDRLNASEMFAVAGAVTAKNDHDAAVVSARSPEPVALMITNRFWQTELRSEEVDRARLAVTVRKNRGPRLFLSRKRFVNPRSFAGHVFPAEFIGKILRQRTRRLVLRFGRFQAEFVLISNELFRRKNRRDGRRENDCRSNEREQIKRAAPFPAAVRNLFKRDRAGGEECRID